MSITTLVAEPALLALGGLVWRWTTVERRVRTLDSEVSQLREQASDSVTELPTRAAWESSACARLAAPEPTMVLIADLDEFKSVNDTLGHLTGDVVLRTISERLSRVFAASDGEVCRLGGDEFGIIATDTPLVDDLDTLAQSITAPITLTTGHQVAVGVSIGCARSTDLHASSSLSYALETADAQLLAAKRHRHDTARR